MDILSALGILTLSLVGIGAAVYAVGAENNRHRQLKIWDD